MAKTKAFEPTFCAGCGEPASASHGSYEHPTGFEIAIGTETAVVCYSDRGGGKLACVRKAREKASRCPGCNTDHVEPGTICDACDRLIEQGRKAGAEDPLSRVALDPWDLIGQGFKSHVGEDDEASQAFMNTLAQALAGRGAEHATKDEGRHNKAWAEVTTPQAKAVEKLVGLWRDALDEARAAGHREGRSLLMGLATGSVSTREFDDSQIKTTKRGDES